MSAPEDVADDEIILRRIPPGNDNIKPKGTSEFRATSNSIKPRRGEEYPSWSRQDVSSAKQLLQIESEKGTDIRGWSVAAVLVSDIRKYGLEVVLDPTDEDPHHCVIRPVDELPFDKKVWGRLSLDTKIAYTEPDEPQVAR